MTMAEKFYADNNMVNVPPRPCDFKVGDFVKFTNDYGVEFILHRVIGFTKIEDELHGRFVHIDTDSPWFPVKPESLEKINVDDVVTDCSRFPVSVTAPGCRV